MSLLDDVLEIWHISFTHTGYILVVPRLPCRIAKSASHFHQLQASDLSVCCPIRHTNVVKKCLNSRLVYLCVAYQEHPRICSTHVDTLFFKYSRCLRCGWLYA